MKWGVILVASGVHQCLMLEQQLHYLQVSMIAGFMLINYFFTKIFLKGRGEW
jgi:hypothetical protein